MNALKILEALADRHRLKIINSLCENNNKGITVNVAASILDITQPTTTHHLAKLFDAGVLDMKKDGNFHIYFINVRALQLVRSYIEELIEECKQKD